ncbi:MAG: AAA domain-containing protein [Chloroflexota bacterium]|nr:AAA domain-containing protein [Chloroflexota bacterium]
MTDGDAGAAWARLLAADGPLDVDVAVLVRKLPEHSSPTRLVVEVLDERRRRLGSAAVFSQGWYPGSARTEHSHYYPVLTAALAGLEARGEEPRLRLRLLRAVNAQRALGRALPFVVLLKYVVAPEFAIAGSRVEQVYQCPAAGLYRHFLNLGPDVLRDASPPSFVSGQAIHRGYTRAARTYLATRDDAKTVAAYLSGVADAWTALFPYLLLDRPRSGRPTQLYRLPVEAADAVLGRCRQLYLDRAGATTLLQERLFFSPARGISGKADRIVEDAAGRELWELKTRASAWAVDKDPKSGRVAPGGIQALAYHEILRTLDATPPRTFVELLDPKQIEGIPIEEHPVVLRAEANVRTADDRYVDLVAQARNVAYVAESGLLTGYDRERLAGATRQGRRLGRLGGDFDLYGAVPPCGFCPAGQRGVCEDAHSYGTAPWFGFFHHVPDTLFEYWAWFHGQLKQAERAGRERLYHLVSTPAEVLERDEGICITDLVVDGIDGRTITLRRERRIETRLREDDRVLITPADHLPGEMHSTEGTIRTVGATYLVVEVEEPLRPDGGAYRVDQLGFWDRGDWQLEGLTDFLLGCMHGSGIRGRSLAVNELPPLAQAILGALLTHLPQLAAMGEGATLDSAAQSVLPTPRYGAGSEDVDADHVRLRRVSADDLNDGQRRAIEAALGLEPGGLLLIQGPPGTGKTTMIAHLVRQLVARGFWHGPDRPRPVLILANTHRACNEVVLKLHRRFPDLRPYLVRVGTPTVGMEPEVREHILGERLGVRERLRSVDLARDGPAALARLVRVGNALHDEGLIFVGTLAAANRPELRGLEFETVIVDETGQATEPAALQALRHLVRGYRGRLVLVGDHRQLPPVVPDDIVAPEPTPALASLGLDAASGLRRSLFDRLATRAPEAVLTLADQYRMCGPISDLVSETFYDGRLRPGTPGVAAYSLRALLDRVGGRLPPEPIPAAVWDPDRPVVLIDTSRDPAARDTVAHLARDETRDNPREAHLIAELVGVLLDPLSPDARARVAREIGVISPYRRQNNRIRQELADRVGPLADLVRVDTVDRFQGGECDVVLISLVASNPAGSIGALHADWRRMNVAISRARAKLVVIGSRRTFTVPSVPEEEAAKERYRRLFDLVDRQAAAGQALVLEPPE